MHSSEPRQRFWRVDRVWEALAIAAIVFAVWKLFVAPRALDFGVHPAPHAEFALLDGGTFRIAHRRSGVLFLDFYASWCTPCQISLPLVERWARAHPDAIVVPVDVGETNSVAAAFARRFSLSNVALDPGSRARALFDVEGFPTVVVIDRANHVRAKWEGLNPAIALAMTNALSKLH